MAWHRAQDGTDWNSVSHEDNYVVCWGMLLMMTVVMLSPLYVLVTALLLTERHGSILSG